MLNNNANVWDSKSLCYRLEKLTCSHTSEFKSEFYALHLGFCCIMSKRTDYSYLTIVYLD